jgi:hypothetical protein
MKINQSPFSLMIVLTATYNNGQLVLERPLPNTLEGKRFQIFIQELGKISQARRKSGSAKGRVKMSADFNAPLEEFESYYS